MANATRVPCRKMGCPNLVRPGSGSAYCANHEPPPKRVRDYRKESATRRANAIDGPLDRFYSSARWQRLRNWFLRCNPICAHCGALGEIVDHVQPRRQGGAELDQTNLQTLCRSCHAKKTWAESARPSQVKRSGPGVYKP